jgi:hypothetical protein
VESPIESNGLPSCEPEMGDESAGLDQSQSADEQEQEQDQDQDQEHEEESPSPTIPRGRVATSYINVSANYKTNIKIQLVQLNDCTTILHA